MAPDMISAASSFSSSTTYQVKVVYQVKFDRWRNTRATQKKRESRDEQFLTGMAPDMISAASSFSSSTTSTLKASAMRRISTETKGEKYCTSALERMSA